MWPSNLTDDLENNRAPLLYYIKLCASFQTHWWIQTAVTVQKPSIWVKIDNFLSCMTLKFDGWPWQTIGHVFYATSSFANHFKAIGEFKLEWQSGNAQFRSKPVIFVPCDLEISRMTLQNNRTPLLGYFKMSSSFHSHLWIRTGVTVRKIPILGLNRYFLALWPWNLTDNLNNRAPLLCYFNLYASFHSHLWIQTGDTVRKRPIWVEIGDFLALWPWNLTDDLENQ